MVVDARTRSRQPKGLPQHVAGTFRPEHADDDTDLGMDPVEAGWVVKDRLERLAAEGERVRRNDWRANRARSSPANACRPVRGRPRIGMGARCTRSTSMRMGACRCVTGSTL